VDKVYNAVVLENEYVKVLSAGNRRPHPRAEDKTNRYVWLYWQRTIKPGLISMTGHGSRGDRVELPARAPAVRIHARRSPDRPECDGSGRLDRGDGTRLQDAAGSSGHHLSGRSHGALRLRLYQPHQPQAAFPVLATAATHANEWSQAQYPGDMVTGHGKHDSGTGRSTRGRPDLVEERPERQQLLRLQQPSDWFGAYDHKAQGGMVHVSGHHLMPGKKLWTGAPAFRPDLEDILSEGEEPTSSRRREPGATTSRLPLDVAARGQDTSDYWYPVRDTRATTTHEGFRRQHRPARRPGLRRGLLHGRGAQPQDRAAQRPSGSVLFEATADIAPDRPFTREVKAGGDTGIYDLHLAVYGPDGKTRIELRQQPPKKVELPPGRRTPAIPRK